MVAQRIAEPYSHLTIEFRRTQKIGVTSVND